MIELKCNVLLKQIFTFLIDIIFVWWNYGVRTVRVYYETTTVYVGKQIKVKNDVTWLLLLK